MSNKIFNAFDLGVLKAEDELSASLKENYKSRNLKLIVLFPNNLFLTLNLVNTRKKDQKWVNQLPHFITEADGSIETSLGVYNVGETIDIGFQVTAPLQDIPRIGILIVGDKEKPVVIAERKKPLKNDESWFKIVENYKVGG